ncbi:Yip1 family protein [Paraferrimonas sp. SM1919]|uniref:Yip1 family protein n=1 Tax=Paraferrimonas sp. SM1919 TaxID=2662263 RepID=UPI0013D3B769|nr:Yip1 family protein [Paraferrimonas sp. SM1919]
MQVTHLWGLYHHPKGEWQQIKQQQQSLLHPLLHVMLLALIPPICGYVASVYIGWDLGAGDAIKLTSSSALAIAIAMYFALLAGVATLTYLIHWMAPTFGASPSKVQALELACYTATPILMVGVGALLPQLWFLMLIGLAGITYSVYLLYSGVPIMMDIPYERGFIYASSIVTCALVLTVAILTGSVILWSFGIGPVIS